MYFCMQCDEKFKGSQYNGYLKMCNKCSKVQRFSMEVEFDHPECDFGVLIDDTLSRLILQYKEAKKTGWHYHIGGCANIKILKIKDNFIGKEINKKELNL
tara:strand:- start:1481 stop:1780 length:300 start_codon:yes stop_codon:yes gene_type:complete